MSKEYQHDGEINPLKLFNVLYKRKILFILIVLSFSLGSVVYALFQPNLWTVTSVLEVSSGQNTSLASNNGSGMFALAGIKLEDDSSSSRAKVLIFSRDLVKRLISHDGVLKNLFAFQEYEEINQSSKFDQSKFDEIEDKWKIEKPNLLSAVRKHADMVDLTIDRSSGFMYLSVTHGSPKFASRYLQLIITELNNHARDLEITATDKSLDYLYNKLNDTYQENVKQAISAVIESQLRKQMFAYISDSYLLNPLDSAYEPDLRSFPDRKKIVIFGTILGGLIAIIFILTIHFFRSLPKD